MVERLRVPVEAVRVVAGWCGAHDVRIETKRRPVNHLLRWSLIAADDAEHIDIPVIDLECVVVTD